MESKNKGIDLRTIKCCCDNPNCAETGISFDDKFLRFHYLEEMDGLDGVTQRTKGMYLDKKNVTELIESLQEILETEFSETETEPKVDASINPNHKPFLLYYTTDKISGNIMVYEESLEKAIEKFKKERWFYNNLNVKSATL